MIFQDHVEIGGRVTLTTNAWSGNNKLDYSAVTGHIITKTSQHISILLDIIKLEDAIHSGRYLYEKLLEITDRFDITSSIISITRNNASPNNTMLEEFEAVVEERWEQMEEAEQVDKFLRFNRIKGDVRYYAHIYNIAVQAGKQSS